MSTDEVVVGRPAPPLRGLVDDYVGYRLLGHAAGVHRGLPSRHLTLVVGIGATIEVVTQVDPAAQRPDRYRAVVGGLQDGTAVVAAPRDQAGVEVELTPLGARALLGVAGHELTNRSHELADVVGPLGDELWERLQDLPSWDARFAACDDVLGRLLLRPDVAPELRRSWDLVVRTAGRVSVHELARETGWSRQHLTRRFRHEFGLAPKRAARVVRFERAVAMLRAGAPLADTAHRCGYADQSHLHRDVADLAGCTPTALVADEVPIFHDVPTAAV